MNATTTSFSPKFLALAMTPLLLALLTLSGCGKSETDICIDQKTKLWNPAKNADNQVYWNAVAQCREKHQ